MTVLLMSSTNELSNMTSMSTTTPTNPSSTTSTTPPPSLPQSTTIDTNNDSSSGNAPKLLESEVGSTKESPTISTNHHNSNDDETEEEGDPDGEQEENINRTTSPKTNVSNSGSCTGDLVDSSNNNLVIASESSDIMLNVKVQQQSTNNTKRDRDNSNSDDDQHSSQQPDDSTTVKNKKSTTTSDNKRVKLDQNSSKTEHRSSSSSPAQLSVPVNPKESLGIDTSSVDVAELARLKAAKFIQERTKMACLLPSSDVNRLPSPNANTSIFSPNTSSSTSVHSSSGQQSSSSSRKRKLTVKDILVSQRNRNQEVNLVHNKHHRIHNIIDNAPPPTTAAAAALGFQGLTNQMFGPAAASILDPSSVGLQQMNDPTANPLAAISAALAAAASSNSGISVGSGGGGPNPLVPDHHSQQQQSTAHAYISQLASTLSSTNLQTNNPTAAFALMASLSAMMQQQQNSVAAASINNKDIDQSTANTVNSSLSQLTNSLVNFESTLAANSEPHSSHNDIDDEDNDTDEKMTDGPMDFSLKNSKSPEHTKSTSKRKLRKNFQQENNSHEESEFPLDLSVSHKHPKSSDDSLSMAESIAKLTANKSNPLSSLVSQVSGLADSHGASASASSGSNSESSNFAAMAAAAAAAAAFSPNLLTRMAASMAAAGGNPWSQYGTLQQSVLGNNKLAPNDAASLQAFQALFQQVTSNQQTQTNPPNSSAINNKSSNQQNNPLLTANSLFQQSFPNLYSWNGNGGKVSKTSTPSPSFGALTNSTPTTSFTSRHHHHPPPPAASQPMRTKSSSGRQNPWQAQWINRSSEQTRDVFTCVWCKESFKSLAEMTDHMKRSPRCGMAGMQQHHGSSSNSHNSNSGGGHGNHHHQSLSSSSNTAQQSSSGQQTPSTVLPSGGGKSGVSSSSTSLSSPSSVGGQTSTNVCNKDLANSSMMNSTNSATNSTNIGASNLLGNPASSSKSAASSSSSSSSGGVNMPRKLVRGQDVWLGRGAEQTRQILKCMWCGQSFKSLADMTQHMKITQHYTNIISQEQIISWRNPEESSKSQLLNQQQQQSQQQVNAVLTCKVCDEPFSSLKDLSNHMVKNSHFKDPATNNSSDGAPSTPPSNTNSSNNNNKTSTTPTNNRSSSSGNQNVHQSDRRKKSLPVRKLLEIERGETLKKTCGDEDDFDAANSGGAGGSGGIIDESGKSQLIECDDCHEKIEARCFLQHIKQCRSKSTSASKSSSDLIGDHLSTIKNGGNSQKSDSENETDRNSHSIFPFDSSHNQLVGMNLKKTPTTDNNSELDDNEDHMDDDSEHNTSTTNNNNANNDDNSGGNVLSALEKLIEKNFDTKSRRSQQTGILQRLGIDEEVFPPWQNMAPSPITAAISPASMMAAAASAAAWNPTGINGGLGEFSRSSSSNSSNHSSSHHGGIGGSNSASGTPTTIIMPQLRYRRNSSSSQSFKDKFNALNAASLQATSLCKTTTESNGSFSSSQETEEESCDDSNSECGNNLVLRSNHQNKRKKNQTSPSQRSSIGKSSSNRVLNFPISSMLSSPTPPARPTSASSTASSSISPSEAPSIVTPLPSNTNATSVDLLNRLTPNSHRSETDDDQDQASAVSPLALYKKAMETSEITKGTIKIQNGTINNNNDNDETDGEDEISGPAQNGDSNKNSSHHPLMQLQKLLDKTDNTGRRKGSNNNINHRGSPFNNNNWNDSGSVKSPVGSSERSPRTTPNFIGSPASVKSEQDVPSSTYLQLKCAFCDTSISSRNAYRSHLAKVHLAMRDSADISAISDEELLLLVLAKSSNLSLVNSLASKVHNQTSATTTLTNTKPTKESRRKSSRTSHHNNDTDSYHEKSHDSTNTSATAKSPQSPQLETSQSKFLKYTELAKQLSSKYV